MVCSRVVLFFFLCALLSVSPLLLAAPDDTPREIGGQVQIQVDENTQFVANFIYQDDEGDSMALTLEGEDAALFAITATGELSFTQAPDYETPADNNRNNTFVLRVNAREVSGEPHAIDVTVLLQAVNEAPVVQSPLEHELVEEQAFQLMLEAEDPEGHSFVYSLDGDDISFFDLSEEGLLGLSISPSFESPFDRDRDNVYRINIVATDEFDVSESYPLTISVLDRPEQGRFSNVTDVELAELATKDGNVGMLFPEVKWSEPDNVFTGQVLTISGLLPEDSITLTSDAALELEVDAVTGEIRYRDNVVANISLAATGQDGDDLIITFNEATNEVSANLILNNLVYSNSSVVPTEQRQIKAVLLDEAGKLTAMQTELAFDRADEVIDLSSHKPGVPALVDIDMDTDLDLAIGTTAGKVHVYLNQSGGNTFDWKTSFETSHYLSQVDVGNNARPAFVDIDADGDMDAFIGNENGFISYFENTTSGANVTFTPRLAAANPLSVIDVGANAALTFVDIDDDADADVFIGNEQGETVFYLNTGTTQAPKFVSQMPSPIDSSLLGQELALAFIDIDSDGDQDAIFGNGAGKLRQVKNLGTARVPNPVLGEELTDPFYGFTFNGKARPNLMDVDGDLDMDVLVYDDSQQLITLKNESGLSLTVTRRENQAPVIDIPAQIDVVEALTVTLDAEITDAESDDFTIEWQQVSGESVELVITNAAELSFVSPNVETETHLAFRITVFDGRDSRSQDVLVRVFPFGTQVAGFHVPEITLLRSLTVNEREGVSLTAQVFDKDAQTITVSWEQLSGPSIELQGADTLTPSFTAPDVVGDTFVVLQLNATDGIFDVQQIISITVQNKDEEVVPSTTDEEDDSTDLFGLSVGWELWLVFALLAWRIYRRTTPHCFKR